MKLGIVYKHGKIINHRSFVKVVFNPILRYFGYQIATIYFSDSEKLGKAIIQKCEESKSIKWEKYDTDFDYIIKKRVIV